MNRARHLPTVADEQPNRVATVLSVPSAHASTIRDRNANACADFARRDQHTSCSRSSLVRTNETLGRPVLAIDRVYNLSCELPAQDTARKPFGRLITVAVSLTTVCGIAGRGSAMPDAQGGGRPRRIRVRAALGVPGHGLTRRGRRRAGRGEPRPAAGWPGPGRR